MLTVHWLSIQDQAGSVKAQSMTKYDRMRRAGIDELMIRNKMRVDLVEEYWIRDFFGEQQPDSDEPGLESAAPTVPKPDLKKYEKMRGHGLPVVVIRNSMKKDGVDAFWQRHFFGMMAGSVQDDEV